MIYRLPDLVIPNNAAVSNTVTANDNYKYARHLAIISPASVEGTTTIEVSIDGTLFVPLQLPTDGTTDQTIDDSTIVIIPRPVFLHLRIATSSNQTGAATFHFAAIE